MNEMTPESATRRLLASFESTRSRRGFLKASAAAGLATAGAGLLPSFAKAESNGDDHDSVKTILSIAATAEQLAITFYTNGVKNAGALGLSGMNLDDFKAFAIEEQIHHDFFVANGGTPLAGTFSFPHGVSTFQNLTLFIETQQQLEGAFDSAFIAAVFEFSEMGLSDLARIACMIAMVEEGHRTVGRQIIQFDPAEQVAFAPQLVDDVNDAPEVLKAAGYLSPMGNNSYTYVPVDFTSPPYANVNSKIQYRAPYVVPEN
ncbi:MAG: ferritin-like domain-containing protein [Chloroflexota bacterium]